jgi:glycine cleavage system T protein (aminomethyltransferase)
MLRTTPFHARTEALCEASNWRRWSGYLAASSYELHHDREYWALRNSAGLIDVSPLHKYMIEGPDAERLLDRVVTRKVTRCAVNQVLYTPWCDEAGKVMDDGTLTRLTVDQFRLTSALPNLRWLQDNGRGMDVRVDDISEDLAALALQGPNARAILHAAADGAADRLGFFRLTDASIGGVPVQITRTGYTGDLGYEIWTRPEHALALWDGLTEAGRPHRIVPAGMLALDIVRVEAGLILIDVDYVPAHHAIIETRKSSPFELGLGWAVKLDKPAFVGREALLAEKARGPEWEFKGLEISWDAMEALYAAVGLPPQLPSEGWRSSVPVYSGNLQVGYATSGCWSPMLKKYIALAHLQTPHTANGTRLEMEITVEHHREKAAARVVDAQFFNPERKRSNPSPGAGAAPGATPGAGSQPAGDVKHSDGAP